MRIVLAYSGGLRSTAAIPWLRAHHRADVVAVTLDLGYGRALEAVRDRALAAGAVRAHVVDGRDSFARDLVLPALRADVRSPHGVREAEGDAVASHGALQPRALGQMAIGPALLDIARIERAVAVAHACVPNSPDRIRMESALGALQPAITTIAVADEWPVRRADLLAGARGDRLPLAADVADASVVDANLWGRTLWCRPGEPTPAEWPESAFAVTRPLAGCPDEPALVHVRFDRGTPTAINGVQMSFVDLVQSLGTIAGAHGVGRARLGDAWVEAPAAIVLVTAHSALQLATWDDEVRACADGVSRRYADVIAQGGWFRPIREMLDASIASAQRTVTGVVALRLCRSEVTVESLEKAAE
jgi:argininosuccinate synthase